MSFYPLPAVFLTDLTQHSSRTVVELGCGDGRFTRVLRDEGAMVLSMDRSGTDDPSSGIDVVADAVRPPLKDVRLLVSANLLRHIWRRSTSSQILSTWINCLAPGGCLYIFEDEPTFTSGPADTYRRLQDWLAGIVPWRRGLLARDSFLATIRSSERAGEWTNGLQANQFTPPDPSVVISLLRGDEGNLSRDVAVLADRVANEGVDYGDFWWARYERENA